MQTRVVYFLLFFLSFFFFENGWTKEPLLLSLDESILLAIRDNPNVERNQLEYIAQKFNLSVQQWQFRPHYSFQASASTADVIVPNSPLQVSNGFNLQPGVSLVTPIGTQLTLTQTNNITHHYNPGLSLGIIQPLIRGFGEAIVESALHDAMDSEEISRLTMEGTLRDTVTSVINAYLDVVSAEQTIKINEDALERAEKSVQQTKLFIKAGHKAGNEIVTVQASVATAKTHLENARNYLLQAQYALLTAIGLDPNTPVHFSTLDINRLIEKYRLPPIDETKNLILENDIQYQVDQITLHGQTTRALAIAEDNTRWQLNLTANVGTGLGSGGGQNSGINSLFNGSNQSRNATLTLTVPIDDQIAKQSVMLAKISLQQAEIGLKQEKWQKETTAINGWNSVESQQKALQSAEDAKQWQEKTYQVSNQKYNYGLIDSLEWQSAQLQLIDAEEAFLSSQIDYLKSLVNLDSLIGNTLKTWNVKVRL